MPIVTTISAEQGNQLQSFINTGQFASAYNLLQGIVENDTNGDSRIASWFEKAASINSNDGSAISEYVRAATISAAEDYGITLTGGQFQEASNNLAQSIIQGIIDNGGIQSLEEIVIKDVATLTNEFGLPPEGWAGTLGGWLPEPLGGLGLPLDSGFYESLFNSLEERGIDRWWEQAGVLGDVLDHSNVGAGAVIDDLLIDAWEKIGELLDENNKSIGDYIDELKDLFEELFAIPPASASPLVFDLDGDGYELSALSGSNIRFDLDVNGFAEQTGWVDADDGFLVFDRNGNGIIDDGAELFGDHTPLSGGGSPTDGFLALADLDSNLDGVIDANDSQFSSLQIWQDLNQDGLSDALELNTLSEIGIISINLNSAPSSLVVHGHSISIVSTFTRQDYSIGNVGDVFFNTDPVNSLFIGDYNLSLDALLQPLVRGYGNVADLHVAMSMDTELLSAVEEFTSTDIFNSGSVNSRIEELLFRWAGTINVDPTSRGSSYDARKLETIEAFLANTFVASNGSNNPSGVHVNGLDEIWLKLSSSVAARLIFQSQAANIIPGTSYDFLSDTLSFTGSLTEIIQQISNQQPSELSDAVAYWINMRTLMYGVQSDLGVTKASIDNEIQNIISGTPIEDFYSSFSNNHIGGTSGDELLVGTSEADIITAGDGNDTLTGAGDSDQLLGGDGDDHLDSNNGNTSQLFGGAGDDVLTASSTNQGSYGYGVSLTGGPGNDTLNGAGYATKYYFNLGDGQDVINEAGGWHSSHSDHIYLGAGILPADVAVTREGLNLILHIGTGGDRVTITNWYAGSGNQVEYLHFDGGTVWGAGTLHTMGLEAHGTEGDDVLTGLADQTNVLYGHGGNDTLSGKGILYGDAGNDTLTGGGDSDQLLGGDGDDTVTGNGILHGDAGNDTLTGNGNSNQLFGDGGNDILSGAGTLNGGEGNDTLSSAGHSSVLNGGDGNDVLHDSGNYSQMFGGAGDDVIVANTDGSYASMTGGQGNDTFDGAYFANSYYFNVGDGQDVIDEQGGASAAGSGYEDKIYLGVGILPSDVAVTREGPNLLINIGTGGDRVKVLNWYGSNGNRVEKLLFNDGTVWDANTLHTMGLEVHGTEGADVLTGLSGQTNVLYGHGGNDTLTGAGTLNGGEGNDTLSSAGHSSVLYGGDGNDVLNDSGNYSQMFGGAGDDILVANADGSYASMTGGQGNDTFDGAYFANSYYFNVDDGQDVIDEQGGASAAGSGYDDKIYLGPGILPADVAVTREGPNLLINIGTAGDRIKVLNWYGSNGNRVEKLFFNDGMVWDVNTLHSTGNQNLEVHGSTNDDSITGTSGVNNYLYGESGNDILAGQELNDVLTGGAGNDLMDGGAGNDAYRFAMGFGQDVVWDSSGNDALNFSAIEHEDLWFWQEGDDLKVGVLNTPDQLTIEDWFSNPNQRIETIQTMDDSYVLLENQVQLLVNAMAVFDVPVSGNLTPPQEDIDAVQAVIATSWQAA